MRARSAADIATTALGPRPLPDLRPTPARRRPSTVQVTADNGLTITAVRAPSSPLIELRLRIPFGGRTPDHAARAELLAETLLLGTPTRSRQQIDAELALVGAQLSAQVNPQRLLISGTMLPDGLPVVLGVLGEVLTAATYRDDDVSRERDRLLEHLTIAAAQPATIARTHLLRSRFGDQPAAWELPRPDLVDVTTPAALRAAHRSAVVPGGSTLTLVGDLSPTRAAALVAESWQHWSGEEPAVALDAPRLSPPGPLVVHHRPGAVQAQTRLSLPGVERTDPDYAAAQIANIIFGGYFSSRLVENLREDKGYTYSAHSGAEFWPGCAAITVSFDTATDVAAAALVEARYEMGRIAVTAPEPAEVEAARNYAGGSLAASLATQAGYASMLSALSAFGLDGSWLRGYQQQLARVTLDQVAEAASRIFAPASASGVMIGDVDAMGAAVARLSEIVIAVDR